MKKWAWGILFILLGIGLIGCANTGQSPSPQGNQPPAEAEKDTIINLVENFGQKIQMVSLQAPKENVVQNMQTHYGKFVSPVLLARWQEEPLKAPGQLVSSPWADHIEIKSTEKVSAENYQVQGDIIEITSVEKLNGGIADRRPITLAVKKIDDRWLIDDVILGNDDQTTSTAYTNTQYGFNFSLPESWTGYSIITDQWQGFSVENPQKTIETGPIISIRHPQWTSENPRQDIPIMIFTLNQWENMQQDKFHIGAAPIGPKELGRNAKYVFALPARYNYAFPTGYEEVENILNSHALQAIN